MKKYTKNQKVKLRKQLALFKDAKLYLWDGIEQLGHIKTHNICSAVTQACIRNPGQHSLLTDSDCYRLIQSGLDGFLFFSSWLRCQQGKHGIPPTQVTDEYIQRCRHAWLDEIIKAHEEAVK